MNFSQETEKVKYSIEVGFIFAYFLFTAMLYIIILIVGKHSRLEFVYVMLTTSALTYLGLLLKKIYQ